MTGLETGASMGSREQILCPFRTRSQAVCAAFPSPVLPRSKLETQNTSGTRIDVEGGYKNHSRYFGSDSGVESALFGISINLPWYRCCMLHELALGCDCRSIYLWPTLVSRNMIISIYTIKIARSVIRLIACLNWPRQLFDDGGCH